MKLKRILFIAGLLACLALVSRSEAKDWEDVLDKTVQVTYRLPVAGATTSTSAIVVDLSDDTNYPHAGTGYLNISSIKVTMDKVAAATSTVRLGVVNYVGPSTGSVSWFHLAESSYNVSNTIVVSERTYTPAYLNLKVDPASTTWGSTTLEGSTPGLTTSEITNASTTYQTDVALPNPLDTATAPGRGDLVLDVQKDGTNPMNVVVEVLYHAVR